MEPANLRKRPSLQHMTLRSILTVTAISVSYLLLSAWLIGYKTDQLLPVFRTIFHGIPHVDFVTVTFYS